MERLLEIVGRIEAVLLRIEGDVAVNRELILRNMELNGNSSGDIKVDVPAVDRKRDVVIECFPDEAKITGGTYDFRDVIKAHGGKWSPEKKAWEVLNPDVDALFASLSSGGAAVHRVEGKRASTPEVELLDTEEMNCV
jgi:hypothetical protein